MAFKLNVNEEVAVDVFTERATNAWAAAYEKHWGWPPTAYGRARAFGAARKFALTLITIGVHASHETPGQDPLEGTSF